MKATRLVPLTLAVVLFVSWLSVAFYPSIQDFMESNPFWNGTADFSSRFGAGRVDDLEEIENFRQGEVLVALAYLPYQPEELERVADFLEAGGTLLLMDDYGYGNQVLEKLALDMTFDGDPLLDPYVCYRNQHFPLATDIAEPLRENGVTQLAMDRATGLHVSGSYEVLARSSETSYLDRDASESLDEGEPEGPFAVVAIANVGRGRVIAVSDPSILINSMVNRGDNWLFLEQVIPAAGGNPGIYVDMSHLPQLPIDRAKSAWQIAKQRMGAPYAQILLVGAVLAVIWMPFRSKGGKIDRER